SVMYGGSAVPPFKRWRKATAPSNSGCERPNRVSTMPFIEDTEADRLSVVYERERTACMTSRVDLCLQEAAECERRAALERDGRIRQALGEMARYWRTMAELAADFEHRTQS